MQVNSPPLKVVTGGQVIGNTAVRDLGVEEQPKALPDLVDYIAWLQERAFDKGIELELCHDFHEFIRTSQSLPGKHRSQREFDPEHSELGPENAIWVRGLDCRGGVVHVQAIRKDELGEATLDRHLSASFTKLYCGPGCDAKLDVFNAARAPALNNISGTVCYHGELWLRGGNDGFRGKGLSAILTRFLLAVVLKKWSPDFVYAFVRQAQVQRGLPAKYGYMHMQPNAIRWEVPPYNTYPDEWLIWLNREDLRYLTQHQP